MTATEVLRRSRLTVMVERNRARPIRPGGALSGQCAADLDVADFQHFALQNHLKGFPKQ